MLIEGGPYGTTCARVGCMPSKLLIAAADAAHHAKHAGPFGVDANVTIDGRRVMDRVKRERDRFVGFVLDSIMNIPASDRLQGRAHFAAPSELEVVDAQGDVVHQVSAKSFVVATGSSPFIPPLFDDVRDRLVVNDDVFAWDTLPRSVAVFGAGVIGLELGQALARLGVRVRIFGQSGTVGPLTDPEVRNAALAAFEEEVPIHTDGNVRKVRRVEGDDGVEVTFTVSGETIRETFEVILVATGRKPNLEELRLENTGAQLDAKGVPVCERATLNVRGTSLFLAGDVTNEVPLLHEAADEGRIAGENAARFPNVHAGKRRSLLAVVFTEPQIAIVGASLATLSSKMAPSRDIVTGKVSFADQGRSRVMLQNRGRGHVYADRETGRFLGAEFAGPRAEHIGHLLAWAHQRELTIGEMLEMPFYHPVVEEGLRTALRDAASQIGKPA